MPRARRIWTWVAPAVIGSAVLVAMSQIGNGSFSAPLLIPGVVSGTLIGFTARGVKRLRPWLGTATTWVLAATLWGLVMFATTIIPSTCPVERGGQRCSISESATWGVNAALVVVLLMLVIEPPKMFVKFAKAARRRKR